MKEHRGASIDRDEPADENISQDPPNQMDRQEGDYEPGVERPDSRRKGPRRDDDESSEDRDDGNP